MGSSPKQKGRKKMGGNPKRKAKLVAAGLRRPKREDHYALNFSHVKFTAEGRS